MVIYLYISSKSLNSLKKFTKIIKKINTTSVLKTKVLGVDKKIKQKKVMSVLKSPHVNKTAQEQFETVTYGRRILVCSYNYLLLFLLVKEISNKVFPELTVKLKFKLQHRVSVNVSKTAVNPRNQKLINNISVTKEYLKIFDCYGELLIQQKFNN